MVLSFQLLTDPFRQHIPGVHYKVGRHFQSTKLVQISPTEGRSRSKEHIHSALVEPTKIKDSKEVVIRPNLPRMVPRQKVQKSIVTAIP